MPNGLDDFRPQPLRLVVAAAQAGEMSRKALTIRTKLSSSAIRTWLNAQRIPTRDNLGCLIHCLNQQFGWRLEVEDFCGDDAEHRIREKLASPLATHERVLGNYRGALQDAVWRFDTHRRPRMKTWRHSRVEWCRMGGFLQPVPVSSRLAVPDAFVYPFVVYWLFWERNLRRERDFSEQFRLSRADRYNDRDFAEIAYFLVREQVVLAATEAGVVSGSEWYTGSTEFYSGNSTDNFGWGRDRLVDAYGCRDLVGLARRFVGEAVGRFWNNCPQLRPFLAAGLS